MRKMCLGRLRRLAPLRRLALWLAAGWAVFLLAHVIGAVGTADARTTRSTEGNPVGGPFSLTDHTGRRVTDEDFRGNYMLVYFGYTYCPDVCPTDLANMVAALDLLGPLADRVQPIFITVDPKRDTVEQLAGYVGLFHPRLIGLTGTRAEIDKAADAYLVKYFLFDAEDNDEYEVAHKAWTFLMGPDGRYLSWFPNATDPAEMARVIRLKINRGSRTNSKKVP